MGDGKFVQISKVGPAAAFTLITLWLEGKHSATYAELQEWEAIVIDVLTRLEHKFDRTFGEPPTDHE